MGKSNVIEREGRAGSTDLLTALLSAGARQFLRQAIEAEVQGLRATHSDKLQGAALKSVTPGSGEPLGA